MNTRRVCHYCASLTRDFHCEICDESAPVPPAGDVKVLGWALNDGDEHPIDVTLQWGIAKHWPEYATPLVDRAHVTRLTARADKHWRALIDMRDERDALQSELAKALEELRLERLVSAAMRQQAEDFKALSWERGKELIKAREYSKELSAMLLKVRDSEVHEGRLLYDAITRLIAHQSAPAAKGE